MTSQDISNLCFTICILTLVWESYKTKRDLNLFFKRSKRNSDEIIRIYDHLIKATNIELEKLCKQREAMNEETEQFRGDVPVH